MLLMVFFSVIAVSTIAIKEIQAKAVQDLDIENFLRSLQQQLQEESSQQQRKSQKLKQIDKEDSSSSDDDDDDHDDDEAEEYRTGSLRNLPVERLIKLAHNDRDYRNTQIQLYKANDNDERGDGLDHQLLEQLSLLQNRNKKRQNSENRDDRNIQLQMYKVDDNDGREVLEPQLIEQLNLLQNAQNRKKKRQNRYDRNIQMYKYDNDDREGLDQELLQQFNLIQNVQNRNNNKKQQNRASDRVRKQRHQPNNLLGSVGVSDDDRSNNLLQSLNNDDRDGALDLSKYSNVYLILNPDTVKKSRNKDQLNNLLSNLLSPSSPSQRDRRENIRDVRYKGFLEKDNVLMRRRRNRESKEIFAKGNSMEGDYRPKRSRGERGSGGGGGGGGSGRTAIPYIRHHGDIYEKDN